jgi:NAD(P)-dependent dehydrogenase (short-subunit alcohol dehydrogenase family)
VTASGKVAVVTGGSRGIGRAIALGLGRAGVTVAVASRDGEACGRVAAEIGGGAIGVACDAAAPGDLEQLFERVRAELGGTDLLVHAAGLSSVAWASDVPRDELVRQLDVHYVGAVAAAQRARRQMIERGGGAILFVTSVWGLGAQPASLAYGAAKAALVQAVKVLAVEWARDRIRVNGLAPGLVETDMTAEMTKEVRDKLVSRIPLRRAATPDEMVGPALFLLGDGASYVTGHVLVADGGERAR